MDSVAELAAAYDRQVGSRGFGARGDFLGRAGPPAERIGTVLRRFLPGQGGMVLAEDLDDLTGGQLDALIAEQCAYCTKYGLPLEWDHHEGLRADLPTRLEAAGFKPQDPVAVMIGDAGDVAAAEGTRARLPGDIRLRPVTRRAEFEAVQELMRTTRPGTDWEWLPDALEDWLTVTGDPCAVVVAESEEGEVVSAGWMRFHTASEFASLWGGATLPSRRGQGLYRALVGHRAALAAERGFRYVQTEALPTTRPTLARLGLATVRMLTPYYFTPDMA
ncbi:GNAT family N-acetyltransferase [Streptomyces sp. NPDC101227]|uniref:GNAT family N-acetyltransferase n=1 Tax=Streptomyces sp. NPDC101227 TaxID=3366136 RepID=UPI0037F55DDF